MNQKNNLIVGIIIALVVVASYNVDANPVEFVEGLPNLAIVAEEMTQVDAELFGTAFISLPLSMFAARNLNSKYVYGPVRAILAAIRTFPSILWAILFVIMVGLGPFAGVLAIIMYTVGFVAKLQYEVIETIDSEPMDAVSSIGVSKWQLIRYVVLPESAPHLLSQMLYMFDYNVVFWV
jgi:phosphonate transport system permease protein